MAEKQITGLGVKAAPLNRTTKGSERMALLAVNANFDGSGAGGDFVPTVVVVSDSGEVVGRFPANDTVAAGDSAEVTFAPFLRRDKDVKAGSGGSTRADFFSQHTITAGNNWAWEWVQQDGPTDFLDLTDPFTPKVVTSGVYGVTCVMQGTVRTPGETGTIQMDLDFGPGAPLTAIPLFAESDFSLQGQPNAPAQHTPTGTVSANWFLDKGSSIDAIGWHSNAADRDFRFFGYVQRIT